MGSNYPAGMVGSSPLSSSKAVSSGSSSDCLNGLKFGQKIYFEDVGLGVPGKSSSGSSNSSAAGGSGCQASPATPTKKGRGLVQSGQPPRCQVEGCNIDLSDAKAYYSRHKVCGMHSKSPVVIVGGIEQRFCQQCSRFHKLAEFDQGKRSCRRRLAGHNERRRKPPHGSLLSSRLGRLSSSVFATGSRGGSILLDFSAYSKLPGEDSWLGTATSDQAPVNHSCSSGKYLQGAWPGGNSKDPSTQMVPAGSSSRAGYSSPVVPLGECFTGASESSCALSLLSNQQWVSRNQASGIGLGNLMNAGGAPMAQSTMPSDGVATVNSYPCSNGNGSWAGFKASEAASNSLHDIRPDLGLNQISQPLGSDFVCDLEMAHHGGSGHYLEVEHSRAYNSSAHEHVHWSL